MILFAFLLFPVFLARFCRYFKLKKSRIIPAILFGAAEAAALCLFLTFFVFPRKIIPFDFSKNLAYFLLTQTFLPVAVSFSLYAILSKDDWTIKAEAFFPLEASFFSFFLPYLILTAPDGFYSAFSLFFKPVLFLIMIFICAFSVRKIFLNFALKNFFSAVSFIFIFAAALFIPPLAETIRLLS